VDILLGLEAPKVGTKVSALARWRGEALTETSGTGLTGFVDPDQMSNPSWTVDLRVVQPVRERFELYMDVFNLTDERFVDSYVVRGRTFLVGLRGRFD
jgi:hypothetical protein